MSRVLNTVVTNIIKDKLATIEKWALRINLALIPIMLSGGLTPIGIVASFFIFIPFQALAVYIQVRAESLKKDLKKMKMFETKIIHWMIRKDK